MLNDIEYAVQTGIDPLTLSAEMAPFTYFGGLWEVELKNGPSEGALDRQEKATQKEDKATLLAKYSERGYAFESPEESQNPSEDVDETPLTAEQKFWGGATPTEELGL